MTKETQLKKKIAALLTRRGVFHRAISQGARSSAGFPDRLAVVEGQALFIEAKAPGRYKDPWEGCRKYSPAQYAFLVAASAAGAHIWVGDEIESLVRLLDALTSAGAAPGEQTRTNQTRC